MNVRKLHQQHPANLYKWSVFHGKGPSTNPKLTFTSMSSGSFKINCGDPENEKIKGTVNCEILFGYSLILIFKEEFQSLFYWTLCTASHPGHFEPQLT